MNATARPASPGRSIVALCAAQSALAAALVGAGGVPLGYAAQRDVIGIPIGAAAGAALFFALAHDGAAERIVTTSSARAWLGVVLAATAVAEEIIWRGFVLVHLRGTVGPFAALIVSTVGFAAAHAMTQGWPGVRFHFFTGAALGLVFLATGSLLAAVTTHVMYNLLFVRGLAPRRSVSR